MVESYFSALSKKQTMLLLTAVTFGGQDATAALEHLPEDVSELLRHRAEKLLEIPRDKRIPLLVQEIKRLVTSRKAGLLSAEAADLAAVLKDERGALVEVLLKALPAGLSDQVREQLPNLSGKAKATRAVKPEVLNVVRFRLDELLARGPRRAIFKFSDILLLRSRELITLCDRLGARALSMAVAGLPEAERDEFLGKLPPDQRQMMSRAASAAASRALREDDARELLGRHEALDNPSRGLRSGGAQRVARACLAQADDFLDRLIERHPGELKELLENWNEEEKKRAVNRGDGGRADVVQELERLEQKGIIDRPVRLAPPPKRPVAEPPPRAPAPPSATSDRPIAVKPLVPAPRPPTGQLPGGKVLPPSPRPGGPPARQEMAAVSLPPKREERAASREMSKAGEGEGGPSRRPARLAEKHTYYGPRRDLVAERKARAAGHGRREELPPENPAEGQEEPEDSDIAERFSDLPPKKRR